MSSQPLTIPGASASPSRERIGVVIPVYNRARILTETLPYVIAQTRPPERLVIVDDGSTDGTADVVERWLHQRQPPFCWRLIRAPHRTAAAARNIGFREVDHLPMVAFLDSDDHWPAEFLERTSALLASSTAAVAVSSDRWFYNASGDQWNVDSSGLGVDAVRWLFENDGGIASCSLFRTAAVSDAGAWDERMESGEDFKLFIDMAQRGDWLYAPGDPVWFNRTSEQTHGEERNLSRRHLDMYRQWAVHYGQIYGELNETDPIRRRALRWGVARKWRDAGIELLKHGRPDEAAEAFAAAANWTPMAVSLRLRWLSAKLSAHRDRSREAA